MLESLKPQLTSQDHLTVVFDGLPIHTIPFDFQNFVCKLHLYREPTPLGYWGHAVRNKYAPLLHSTDFVMHADDDDHYARHAFSQLRQSVQDKTTLYVAQMVMAGIYPKEKLIYSGNIGTPMGIIPYLLNTQGQWHLYGGGDGFFYEEIAKKVDNIVFLDFVIYVVRDSHYQEEDVVKELQEDVVKEPNQA